ncbi:MAG TPA: M3 family oligoendopeptidase [Tepidisphaeraceae bacterium]|nr:M3 family oligoendopeptidase [Tepidisphaeraceae bacterium]
MTATAPARSFVPMNLDVADTNQLRPLFDDLLQRPLNTAAEAERWLADYSELASVIDEYGSRRYIDKSCHTDDPQIETAFLHFVEVVEPFIKPLDFQLQKKLLDSAARKLLSDPRHHILIRNWAAEAELFREQNVPLQTQVTRLNNEYDKISGAMVVQFRGKEYTLQQLARFVEEPDRPTRQQAWETTINRRLQDREPIEAIYDQLISLRRQIATNAGLPDYRAYAWKSYKRFDYSPQDCIRFADAIAATCVPLVRELDRTRAADLKQDRLRPWDLQVDAKGRPPLRPFDENNVNGFIDGVKSIFHRLSPALAGDFESLRTRNNLDLQSRKGKQPGGYQQTLNESREPFIFMNAAGVQRDVETLLHEGGHAFHCLAARDEPLVFLRHAPMEFCEVASMSMELLGSDHFDVFYNASDAARARHDLLEGIIRFLPWMAMIDSFQQWVYTHPTHTREERATQWLATLDRFGGDVDWTGYEQARTYMWQRQLHLFHVPFYYIEYGIAQLGALQLWLKSRHDLNGALTGYRAALKLGGTRPLPELFSAAGIAFDFSEKTLRPLVNALREELHTSA